jgi:hypothetical protein
MTWTQPQNLDDNTIVTSDYWNSILGATGSLFTVNKQILTRANCNIHTARFNERVNLGNSTSTSPTTTTKTGFRNGSSSIFNTSYAVDAPSTFSIPGSNQANNNYPFTNTQSSSSNVLTGVPFIVLWQFKLQIYNNLSTNAFRIRTTIEREYKQNSTSDQTVYETIAAQYFYSPAITASPGVSTDYYSSSLSYVSHSNSDRYWITINHGAACQFVAVGHIMVIINPGMV